MRLSLKYTITFIIAIGAVFYILLSHYGEVTFVNIINSIFYVGLTILSFGLILFVVEKGVFDGTIYGMKRFWKTISKKQQYIDEYAVDTKLPFDQEDDNDHERKRSFTMTAPLILTGASLFVLSFVFTLWA